MIPVGTKQEVTHHPKVAHHPNTKTQPLQKTNGKEAQASKVAQKALEKNLKPTPPRRDYRAERLLKKAETERKKIAQEQADKAKEELKKTFPLPEHVEKGIPATRKALPTKLVTLLNFIQESGSFNDQSDPAEIGNYLAGLIYTANDKREPTQGPSKAQYYMERRSLDRQRKMARYQLISILPRIFHLKVISPLVDTTHFSTEEQSRL